MQMTSADQVIKVISDSRLSAAAADGVEHGLCCSPSLVIIMARGLSTSLREIRHASEQACSLTTCIVSTCALSFFSHWFRFLFVCIKLICKHVLDRVFLVICSVCMTPHPGLPLCNFTSQLIPSRRLHAAAACSMRDAS